MQRLRKRHACLIPYLLHFLPYCRLHSTTTTHPSFTQLHHTLWHSTTPGGYCILTVWATEQEDPAKTLAKWLPIPPIDRNPRPSIHLVAPSNPAAISTQAAIHSTTAAASSRDVSHSSACAGEQNAAFAVLCSADGGDAAPSLS